MKHEYKNKIFFGQEIKSLAHSYAVMEQAEPSPLLTITFKTRKNESNSKSNQDNHLKRLTAGSPAHNPKKPRFAIIP